MEAHDREGVLAGMMPEATARMLAVLPRAMAVDALQALIQPIAQQVLKSALKWGPIQGLSSPNSSWSIDSKMRLSCSDGNAKGSQATRSLVCCN